MQNFSNFGTKFCAQINNNSNGREREREMASNRTRERERQKVGSRESELSVITAGSKVGSSRSQSEVLTV